MHHQHTGRVRPHEHTGYTSLAIMLVAVCAPLTLATVSAVSPGPSSGSVGLSGTVASVPPKTAAVIQTPSNGARFTTSPVTIAGTCPNNTLVEIFKNDIFAGSTPCSGQKFSIDVDLLIGENKVVARVYDVLNQVGPDSNSLTLYYDALTPQSSAASNIFFGGSQIILNTNAVFRGAFPGQNLSVPIDVLGGTPPYALNVQWGDSKNQIASLATTSSFKANHIYATAGTYRITIQATDKTGRVAFLTVASVINGQSVTTASTGDISSQSNPQGGVLAGLAVLWPLYTAAAATVLSFWLGERREKKVLVKHGLINRAPLLQR